MLQKSLFLFSTHFILLSCVTPHSQENILDIERKFPIHISNSRDFCESIKSSIDKHILPFVYGEKRKENIPDREKATAYMISVYYMGNECFYGYGNTDIERQSLPSEKQYSLLVRYQKYLQQLLLVLMDKILLIHR